MKTKTKEQKKPMPTYHARIKPHDPKRGHVALTRTFSQLGGLKFDEGRVYQITDAEADILRRERMIAGDETSPLCFDILPADEMAALLAAEAKDAEVPPLASNIGRPTRLGRERGAA